MNSISGVQWWHTNQYSLPLGLSLLYLKLRPCSRQMVQHISWSQGCSTSPLISESILQTSTPVWTTPDSIIRLPSLLSLLSSSACQTLCCSSICNLLDFALQKSKWLPLTITLQLQSHCLGHLSTWSCISVNQWLICQTRHNAQDDSISETIHLWGLPPVQSNLPRQFCLSLAQVLFLQTMILIGRMLPLLILILIII